MSEEKQNNLEGLVLDGRVIIVGSNENIKIIKERYKGAIRIVEISAHISPEKIRHDMIYFSDRVDNLPSIIDYETISKKMEKVVLFSDEVIKGIGGCVKKTEPLVIRIEEYLPTEISKYLPHERIEKNFNNYKPKIRKSQIDKSLIFKPHISRYSK